MLCFCLAFRSIAIQRRALLGVRATGSRRLKLNLKNLKMKINSMVPNLPVLKVRTGCVCLCSPAGGKLAANKITFPVLVPTQKQGPTRFST